jgi:hypothetical protein
MREGEFSENLDIDGRIILKWISKELRGGMSG